MMRIILALVSLMIDFHLCASFSQQQLYVSRSTRTPTISSRGSYYSSNRHISPFLFQAVGRAYGDFSDSDKYFDEADELLSFVDAYDDQHEFDQDLEFDYVIQDGESRNQDMNTLDFDVSKLNITFHESLKGTLLDDDDDDRIDNLIVPDLSTLLANIQLAPASEIAYFYLQNTIGLPDEVMWKITNEHGSVLGFTVQNLEQKISLLRRMMNLTDDDVRTILTKQPPILHLSARRNLSPTILFLVRALDLSKTELRSLVVAYPCILCYSMQNLSKKLEFYRTELELDTNQIRELLLSDPRLLCAAVESLEMRLGFLHKEIKIPIKDLQTIIRKNPRIMLYSLMDNLQPKIISFLIMRLYMDPKDIVKLLTSYPAIMDYNLENHMLPIARYFLTELEFSPMELKKILLKFPRLMTHSMFKIKHVVGFLRFQLGMDADKVKRILYQAPQVISLSTDDTLVSKVNFLEKEFQLQDEDLRKVISGMPSLLCCDLEKNLRPKVVYLMEEFGNDALELRQAIITLPTLLGYSLDKRIRPRLERLKDVGVEPIKITVGITMTEDNFEKWLENKRIRIENGGKLLKHNNIRATASDSNEIEGDNDDNIPLQEDNRFMHWKR